MTQASCVPHPGSKLARSDCLHNWPASSNTRKDDQFEADFGRPKSLQVELKTTPETPDQAYLQKAADFIHAFILGESVKLSAQEQEDAQSTTSSQTAYLVPDTAVIWFCRF